ncbi:MAG: GTPase Era [Cellulomonadaceae bacterium TMED98]|nr:MAG: GTPase Era [Cellulomonadaceae bacterium TMED98]
MTAPFRAGFVSLVGRPNVGKSTLANALVGTKMAITSSKPQTTRRVIRGILTTPEGQLIFVDTPGIHKPRTLLGTRLNALVEQTLADVDVIVHLFPATEKVGPGDRHIRATLDEFPRAKKVAVVSKVDLADRHQVLERLVEVDQLGEWDLVVPLSAVSGHQLDTLVTELLALMPESPQLYPDGRITDDDEDVHLSELIREAALEGVRDELPHSLAVVIDERQNEPGEVEKIFATLYVERDSQKRIMIGTGGARLKDIGSAARKEIETLLGHKVFLSLHVAVSKEWQRDPKKLGRLGF